MMKFLLPLLAVAICAGLIDCKCSEANYRYEGKVYNFRIVARIMNEYIQQKNGASSVSESELQSATTELENLDAKFAFQARYCEPHGSFLASLLLLRKELIFREKSMATVERFERLYRTLLPFSSEYASTYKPMEGDLKKFEDFIVTGKSSGASGSLGDAMLKAAYRENEALLSEFVATEKPESKAARLGDILNLIFEFPIFNNAVFPKLISTKEGFTFERALTVYKETLAKWGYELSAGSLKFADQAFVASLQN